MRGGWEGKKEGEGGRIEGRNSRIEVGTCGVQILTASHVRPVGMLE